MACGSCCVAHRLPPEWETHTQVSQAPQQSHWALPVQDGVRSTDPMARGSVWLSRELATAIPKVRAELGGPHCRQEASVSSPIPSHWGGAPPAAVPSLPLGWESQAPLPLPCVITQGHKPPSAKAPNSQLDSGFRGRLSRFLLDLFMGLQSVLRLARS